MNIEIIQKELLFLEKELAGYEKSKEIKMIELRDLKVTIERHIGSIVTVKKLIKEAEDGVK